MARLINLKLLADFFNKIDPSCTLWSEGLLTEAMQTFVQGPEPLF